MQALEQLVADGRIARGLPATATTDWGLQTFAGSLAELQDTSRCCALTLTAQLILEAQQQHTTYGAPGRLNDMKHSLM